VRQTKTTGSWLAAVVLTLLPAAGSALAEDVKEGAKEPVKVSLDAPGGGVTLKYGDSSFNLGVWGQFRWTGDDKEDFDADTAGTGVGHEDGFSNSFSIPRIRFYAQGTLFKTWIGYKFEYEVSSTNTDGASKVKDGYVEVTRYRMAAVRMGQFKVPFSLQELTSDQRQEFIERAITNPKFAAGRDQGIMLFGATADKRFGYQAGVFNGGGEGRNQDDQKLMGVAHVWTAPLGEYKLSEGPLDNADKFVFEVGAGYRTGEAARGAVTAGQVEDVNDESAWNVETAVRFWRCFGTAEYFKMSDEQDDPNPTVRSAGWHVQFGIMVVPKHLEVAGRYALINPDGDAHDADVVERRLALTYFLAGHNLKLQLDGGQIAYGAGYAGLSAIAKRNIVPALGTRLSSNTAFQDEQYRLQAQVVF
jgi:phosphate-selective porin OprO/OprP